MAGVDIRRESIGRRNEIERLTAYRRAASEGRGSIVLVGGEAGIGKSELLRHFETGIASGTAAFAVLVAVWLQRARFR